MCPPCLLAAAIIFCYINQVTIFTASMALYQNGVEKNRHSSTCKRVMTQNEARRQHRSPCYIRCCTGSPPKTRKEVEGPIEKYSKLILSNTLIYLPVKIFILLLFAAYLGVAIWGTVNLQQGILLENLVADDSYHRQYIYATRENYQDDIIVSFVIDGELDYSSADVQSQMTNLLDAAKDNTYVNPSFQLSWLSDYIALGSPTFDSSSLANFISNLKTIFLPAHPHYSNDIQFDSSGTEIVASRVYVKYMSTHIDSNVDTQLLFDMREIASNSPLPVFVHSAPFIFFEQYSAVLPSTLQTMGIAVAAVFVVTFIFMPHPVPIILVTATVAMIMTGIFGFMHLWGLTLSTITMIHIIMSVGFSVDFAAHICHAYMQAEGYTRNERMVAAIDRAAGPIFNGALSTIIGIIMLAFAKSYVFRAFFKVMLLVILFGLCHAILFLPVVLSLIGPLNSRPQKSTRRSPNGSRNAIIPSAPHHNVNVISRNGVAPTYSQPTGRPWQHSPELMAGSTLSIPRPRTSDKPARIYT
jgi:predicted RND superfamily exporter protein